MASSSSSIANTSARNDHLGNIPATRGSGFVNPAPLAPASHASAASTAATTTTTTVAATTTTAAATRSTLTAFVTDPRGPPASGHGPDRDLRPVGSDHGSPPASAAALRLGARLISDDDAAGLDTPSSTDATPPVKKRKASRGQRGVANLTPEQLERKRANDREAQRAIRERQRLRTEKLEREIAELKNTQPHRELQRERQQKEAVEAELAEVKRSLAAILAIIQPILGGSNPPIAATTSTAAAAAAAAAAATAPPPSQTPSCMTPGQTYDLPRPPPSGSTNANHTSTPTSATSPVSAATTHAGWPGALSPVASASAATDGQQPPEMVLLNQQRHDLVHNLELGPDRLGLSFLVGPDIKVARIQNGINGAQDSPQYRHVPMKHDWKNSNFASIITSPMPVPAPPPSEPPPPLYTPGLGGLPNSGPAPTNGVGASEVQPFAVLPRNCPPTCPLDSLLLDFAAERRQRAIEGLSQSEILGPRYPSVSSLLNPAVAAYSHPLSRVFTDIISCFPDLSALPERVAVLYVMFLVMRWLVAPSHDNFLRMPDWIRPLPCQTDKPHPAWIDHIPFPAMREKMVAIYEPGALPFENFFIPFTTTLSVNWPYDDALVLLADPTGDELMINPVFEQHLRNLDNWTLGPRFKRAYPELAGCFNLKRDDGSRVLAGMWGAEKMGG
ncbi:hypothetical protein VTJ83DRAFT_6749 [Remersonia thermophila]|uniref:BZIP transcription factor n=1 Tax=Remersonia thermophila TaxID=72144 RepID=A0ABR4D7S4_9PEZI